MPGCCCCCGRAVPPGTPYAYEDEDGAVRSNQLAAEFVRDRLQQFQLNITVAMSGEVRVSRIAGAMNPPTQASPAPAGAGGSSGQAGR